MGLLLSVSGCYKVHDERSYYAPPSYGAVEEESI